MKTATNLDLVTDEIMHIAESSMHEFTGDGFSCDVCSREQHSVLHYTDKSSRRNQLGDFGESLAEALNHFRDWNS